MADEVVEACLKLWGSWDKDAFIMDQARGIFADPAKVHYANYAGQYVRTRGPLSIPQSAQGHPVLMQAGSSERGRQFAARWAEVVFVAQRGKAEMQAFYNDLKGRLAAHGRTAAQCAILVQISCVVGETEAIARERADYVNSLLTDELALATTSANVGVDMSRFDGKGDITGLRGNQGMQGSLDYLEQMRAAENLSITEAAKKTAASRSSARRNPSPTSSRICSPATRATASSSRRSSRRSATKSSAAACGRKLQRRGLFRKAYTGKTLREHRPTRDRRKK